jgi:hypothetical protein
MGSCARSCLVLPGRTTAFQAGLQDGLWNGFQALQHYCWIAVCETQTRSVLSLRPAGAAGAAGGRVAAGRAGGDGQHAQRRARAVQRQAADVRRAGRAAARCLRAGRRICARGRARRPAAQPGARPVMYAPQPYPTLFHARASKHGAARHGAACNPAPCLRRWQHVVREQVHECASARIQPCRARGGRAGAAGLRHRRRARGCAGGAGVAAPVGVVPEQQQQPLGGRATGL